MIFKRSTPPPVALPREKDIVQKVVDYRTQAFFNRVAAVAFAAGAVFLVVKLEVWYPLCVLSLTVTLLLRAHWIDGYAKREAEKLPQAPQRERGSSVWQRVAWWIARRRMTRKAVPRPYRPVKVAGVEEAVLIPRQPAEMRNAKEPPVVRGYTASDLYWIACRAVTLGLGEKAVDEGGRAVWRGPDNRWTLVLPSGRVLSRDGFREVQRWLVEHKYAVSAPAYQLVVTPETVLENLK